MGAGLVAGAILDAAWKLYGLPLSNDNSQIPGITKGDIIQFGISNGIAVYGFTNANRAAPFGYGMVLANVFTKVIAPSFGLPRYGLFDLSSSGAIVPLGGK